MIKFKTYRENTIVIQLYAPNNKSVKYIFKFKIRIKPW